MKDMQTEQLLCWNGMTDTEHSTGTTSSSIKEEAPLNLAMLLKAFLLIESFSRSF